LLASFAMGPSAPKTALLLTVERAEIRRCAVLERAHPWDRATHLSSEDAPNMMALGAAMMANQRKWLGILLWPLLLLLRWMRPLFAFLDRRNLRNEGYSGSREAKVVGVTRETDEAVSLLLEDRSGADFVFKPGQFFGATAEVDGKRVRRSYSAASAPGRLLRLTIKRTGGVFSTWANESAKAGDGLTLTGPSGAFCLDPQRGLRRELVLVAAGSGITPVMSMAITVLAREPKTLVTLLYGNRRLLDVIYAAELAELERQHAARFKVRHVLTMPPDGWEGGRGRLDKAGLPRELDLLRPSDHAEYYVCGPEPMLDSVRVALRSRGVPDVRVHEERFAAPKLLASTVSQDMTVLRGDETIGSVTVAAGQTILEAGLAAGLPLPFSCGSGACGECRVKLCRGEVIMAEPNCLPAKDRANGAILACVARPLTAVEVAIDK
jgi:ferredoxin-NADP reductase